MFGWVFKRDGKGNIPDKNERIEDLHELLVQNNETVEQITIQRIETIRKEISNIKYFTEGDNRYVLINKNSDIIRFIKFNEENWAYRLCHTEEDYYKVNFWIADALVTMLEKTCNKKEKELELELNNKD